MRCSTIWSAATGKGGYSLHPVHGLRCQVARHIGDVATADAEFERWRTAPQDESSDCAGCVPTPMAFHLAWRGAHAEAIAIAEPVLSGELTCVEQPQGILSALIEPYLRPAATRRQSTPIAAPTGCTDAMRRATS